jgi:anti-anti-sigma factor
MPVEKWSENVIVVRLGEDPHLGDDLDALDEATVNPPAPLNAVVDFTGVRAVNSSTLARLIKVRRQMNTGSGRLILCGMNDQVWGAFLVTNLDKLFDVSDSVAMALATVQINPATRPKD